MVSNSVSVIDTATNKVNTTIPVGEYPVAVGQFIGPVTKSNSTLESNNSPSLNPINKTENQKNSAGVTENAETAGIQEEKSNTTKESNGVPFISSFWVITIIIGTFMGIRNMK